MPGMSELPNRLAAAAGRLARPIHGWVFSAGSTAHLLLSSNRRAGPSLVGSARAIRERRWRIVSLSRRVAKRILAHPVLGPLAAKVTMRQISAYERRLPLLWSVYAHIPDTNRDLRATKDEQERLLATYYRFLRDQTGTYPHRPTISVIVPVFRPQPQFLSQALQSVALQAYSNWELCIVDDCSGDPAVRVIVERFQARHPDKVRVRFMDRNEGISGASNVGLELATGEYCALLDHDDRLYPNALAEVVRHINQAMARGKPLPEMLYSDERVIGERGEPLNDPFLKPDWSPLMHLSVNYTTHLSVYRTDLLRGIGGFRKGFEGSQDHDLALRAAEAAATDVEHIPAVLYQWRAHQGSTARSLDAKPEAAGAGVRAVREACQRRGIPADVTFEEATGHYRLDFAVAEPHPLVSIIIPTRNAVDLLRGCLESIRMLTTYEPFEVIVVDNGSDESSALAFIAELESDDRIRVVRDNEYFNFARLCNRGAQTSKGQYLLLLNNDTEVLTPTWLEAMVGVAQMPDTGAVGAKLLYGNGRVQHAGVVGLGDVVAGHAGRGRSPDDPMYSHLINTLHESMAVTGACLMIAKQKYDEVGGLNESWVPNAYGDVDLCLRLHERGYSNVYTPYAVLHHLESPSRRANIETFERIHMRQEWGSELLTDPFVNPNLIRSETYSVDHRFRQPELPSSIFDKWLSAADQLPWITDEL